MTTFSTRDRRVKATIRRRFADGLVTDPDLTPAEEARVNAARNRAVAAYSRDCPTAGATEINRVGQAAADDARRRILADRPVMADVAATAPAPEPTADVPPPSRKTTGLWGNPPKPKAPIRPAPAPRPLPPYKPHHDRADELWWAQQSGGLPPICGGAPVGEPPPVCGVSGAWFASHELDDREPLDLESPEPRAFDRDADGPRSRGAGHDDRALDLVW